MVDYGDWSEEGATLAKKFSTFRILSWVFVAANVFVFLDYAYMWSVLQREWFYLDAGFLYMANRAWLVSYIAAVPVAVAGLGWISKAFRGMGDPVDDEVHSGEKIAFGFVFPFVSFVAPQRIVSALYDKSCRFGGVGRVVEIPVGAWALVFWAARLMDFGRIVARLAMDDYPGFTPVAFFAMSACALNVAFALLTLKIFQRILAAQTPVLRDAKLHERSFREAVFGKVAVHEVAPTPSIQPMMQPAEPAQPPPERERGPTNSDPANPFSIRDRDMHSWASEALDGARPEDLQRLAFSDIVFSTNGRLSRGTYVRFALVVGLISVVLRVGSEIVPAVRLVWLAMLLPMTFVSFALSIKRWHDLGKTGWMVLVNFIPVAGWIYSFVKLWFTDGDPDRNAYGAVERQGCLVLTDSDKGKADFYSSL